MGSGRKIRLYVHLPFCVRKCAYCDFLSFPADEGTRDAYLSALREEIRLRGVSCRDASVPSIFIGGGTPSVLDASAIAGILDDLRGSFCIEDGAEVTVECNPGTLDWQKARVYKEAGVNRVSLGLQSARDEELRILGRIHTYAQFLESYGLLREAGFWNLNVDLMSGLPGQGLAEWEETLEKVVRLRPEHISAYGLMIEEGTPFYEKYGEDERRREAGEEPHILPSEETERAMYARTGEYLACHGYSQYEISNYARSGYACRHNIGYWRRENYLGLGLGAASLLENRRFSNTRSLAEYLSGAYGGESCLLSRKEQMEEFVFLGLRMREGISLEEFTEEFGVPWEGIYGRQADLLCREGLLEKRAGRLSLTREGISVSNYVMAQFL